MLISDLTGVRYKYIQSWMRPILSVCILLCDYLNLVIGCVFTILHTVNTCKYELTSRFAYLLGPFLNRASILLSCCRTPDKNSDCCNIMLNIMIVFLPHNVRVHTIAKVGYSSMQEHNDAWGRNIFIHYHVKQPLSLFLRIISFYNIVFKACIGVEYRIFHIIHGFMSYHAHNISFNISYHIMHVSYHKTCHNMYYIVIYRIINTSHHNTCHNINITYHCHIISQTFHNHIIVISFHKHITVLSFHIYQAYDMFRTTGHMSSYNINF